MLTTPVEGYIACCEALSTLDQRDLLPKIKGPTLVIAGRHDMSTTIADAEFMRSRIPGASMTILDAAHISNVEQPHAFTDALVGFLTQQLTPTKASLRGAKRRSNPVFACGTMDCFAEPVIGRAFAPTRWLAMTEKIPMDDDKRRDDGMAQRRKVLGNEWVDKSVKNRNAFNTDFQDLITRYAWGDIWTRPHFDHRTRRVLVIGTMVALGQWDEFRLHVRAALAEGGFTPDDIKEILLQQAIYCGVPAANHAVKEANAIISELGLLKG